MNQHGDSTVPFYQKEVDFSELASYNQVSNLKKWIIAALISNIISFLGIIGFLIFIYYTVLIEIENGE